MSENTPDIFSVTEISVVLTYKGLGIPPITFYMRPFLHREEEEMRQAHFALPDAEQKKGSHAYNVDLLCRLITRAPEGLPGDFNGNAAEALRVLLIEATPIKVKLVSEAMRQYYTVTQPAEFFR